MARFGVDEVVRRVAMIGELTDDPESAHSDEDRLHMDVLTEIALGADDPVALARAALETRSFDFPRWCA